jgi:hypothetical protein
MSLTPSIIGHIQRVTELGSQQGSQLHEVRRVAKVLNDQALTRLLSELQSLQASLQAECNWLKAELAAAQMTGVYAKPALAVTTLELHPANLPLPHPELPREQAVWTGERIKPQGALSAEELMRMQATLHRAGDHTLDLDDEEERP